MGDVGTPKSKAAFARAVGHIPGGVNSPVRAFKSVGGDPLFIAKGKGAHLWDLDGNRYVDYVGSWGPLILGHAHPEILDAIDGCDRRFAGECEDRMIDNNRLILYIISLIIFTVNLVAFFRPEFVVVAKDITYLIAGGLLTAFTSKSGGAVNVKGNDTKVLNVKDTSSEEKQP